MITDQKHFKGFTLIEILVVVALIAILAAITIIAINPAKNFADTRNAQRSSNVAEILNAITQYTSDQNHSLTDFGTVPTCPTTVALGTATGNLDITSQVVPAYMVAIPTDPQSGTAANTGYTVCQTGGRVVVAAPNAENGKTISVER